MVNALVGTSRDSVMPRPVEPMQHVDACVLLFQQTSV